MNLKDLTPKNCVIHNMIASSREEALRYLIDAMKFEGHITDSDSVIASIMERENRIKMVLHEGLWLPRTSSNAVTDITVGLARFKKSLENGLNMIVVVVTPNPKGRFYMNTLLMLAETLSNMNIRESLMACRNQEDLYNTFVNLSQ